jgi:type IV pilus assembly protein PilE
MARRGLEKERVTGMKNRSCAARAGLGRTRTAGLSLIEVLVVMVIIVILATIAFPAYNEQTRKARRADAQAALAGLAVAMERYYTEQSPSTYVGAALGTTGIFPSEAPLDGANKFYDLSIATVSASTYMLHATPKNGQAGDACGTLTLSSTGVKGVSGASRDWSDCWR